MIPPPNVTGSLHMGHAFQDSLMDVLVRYSAQNQKKTFWQVGTDHAGIATQMVVNRLLASHGVDSRTLSRSDFVSKIWEWKEQSGGKILSQLKRLGVFIDWEKERFTLDTEYSASVTHAFIKLYRDGLIYKSQRLVNWDCALQSAVSDLEVETSLEDNPLYTLRYWIDGEPEPLCVSTTRPETLFGDLALAVHPDDQRYASLVGKHARLPLTDRTIPVIADARVEQDFGTGVVKITPAHDFFDFAVGQDHELGFINILDKDGKLNEQAGEFAGQDRLEARPEVVAALDAAGLLEKTEPHQSNIPRSSRTGAVVEPYLTDQWYVSMKGMAEKALEAHRNGDFRFTPENWGANYEQWLENIQDWCISRQLVWGHQIPAWTDQDGTIYVGYSEEEVREHYNLSPDHILIQDPDVLDTWFSSALWPFATLGWPDKDWDATSFFPNNVLITGFDIIFFWVARMVMFSLYFTGKVPFRTVYIHGLIQDHQGVKMSKSKGNVIDPIDLIDGISLDELVEKRTYGLMQPEMKDAIIARTKEEYPEGFNPYGADPLRLTFALQATPTRFIRFDLQKMNQSQQTCHKLWNLVRFALPHMTKKASLEPPKHLLNRWAISTLHGLSEKINSYLTEQYRFDLYAQSLVDVMWGQICDRYVEYAKVLLKSEQYHDETAQTLTQVVRALIGFLHPVIPFMTEELGSIISQELGEETHQLLVDVSPQSLLPQVTLSSSESEEIDVLFELIKDLRRLRSQLDIPPKEATFFRSNSQELTQCFETFSDLLAALANTSLSETELQGHTAVGGHVREEPLSLLVPAESLAKRRDRLSEDLQRCLVKIAKTQQRLDNEQFCANAPAAILQKERDRLSELNTQKQSLEDSLSLIG